MSCFDRQEKEDVISMNLRENFRYELHWHTRHPDAKALSSNKVFYEHCSKQELCDTFHRVHKGRRSTRLMLSEQELERLRQRVESDSVAKGFYSSLYYQAEQLLDTCPPDTPQRHTLQNRMLVLCMVYRLSGEKRFFDRAWQELARYCAFTTWMYTEKLDAGYILKGIAIGYDWLYNALSDEQRERLRTAVLKNAFWYGVQVYRNPYRKGLDAHYILQNTNHNVSLNCGMIMAACAMIDDKEMQPLCAEVIESALWALENYLPEFFEHGCGKEGVYYWYWPMTSAMEIIFSLQSTFGTDYGICSTPGFADMGWFPIYMTGATGKEFNWGNAQEDVFAVSEALQGLALLLNEEAFAAYRLRAMELYSQTPTVYDLLWYRPLTAPLRRLPLDRCFERTESVGLFSALLDQNALSICMKGGYNNEVHGSLCAGSFVIDAQGERWASLPGAEQYHVPNYWDYSENGTRWTYYRMRAEGQNAIVINPAMRPDQSPMAVSPIIAYASHQNEALAVIDATQAFSHISGVHRALRGVRLTKGRCCAEVQDEVTGKQMDYWWLMHTRAEIVLSRDGRCAVLRQNEKQMYAVLCGPKEAVFQVLPAQPLPGTPNPPQNSCNEGLRRLAVHLPNADRVNLCVRLCADEALARQDVLVPLIQACTQQRWHLA